MSNDIAHQSYSQAFLPYGQDVVKLPVAIYHQQVLATAHQLFINGVDNEAL